MTLSRRAFLGIGGLAAVSTATGCRVIGSRLAQDELPELLQIPATPIVGQPTESRESTELELVRRLLDRAGFGARPGDVERVWQVGYETYLEEQLNPEDLEDTAVDLMLQHLNLYQMDASQLVAQEPGDAAAELIGSTVFRACYSKRQLYEAMVGFWSDHFNIYLRKNQWMPALKLIDDRDVIRPHALGKFRDLLFASAHSPAMLVYLDNVHNVKEEPNENYARELMELHTLGVDGGYTQQDVVELARMLTGWGVARRGRRRGYFNFDAERHDQGEKLFLGRRFETGRGESEIEEALEILVTHPATARFISTKLTRRFVADEPPKTLVEHLTDEYLATDGNITSMLRLIFSSNEFVRAPLKLKRPFAYLISSLRILHADLAPGRELRRRMQELGQPLFLWLPPNGYPDVSEAWVSTLLPRWNLAAAIAYENLAHTAIPLERIAGAAGVEDAQEALHVLGGLILGRPPDGKTMALLSEYVGQGTITEQQTQQRMRDAVALLLASPDSQWA